MSHIEQSGNYSISCIRILKMERRWLSGMGKGVYFCISTLRHSIPSINHAAEPAALHFSITLFVFGFTDKIDS
ncbi:MAG: hypothetical protein V4507_12490 [Verrucomicrobiota bacterium]